MSSNGEILLNDKDKISCCLGQYKDRKKCKIFHSVNNPEGNRDGDYFPNWDKKTISDDCKYLQALYCKSNKVYNPFNKEIKAGREQEFCGCNYPEEYYEEVGNDLLNNYDNLNNIALLGDKQCYAPSCAKANALVKPDTECGNTTIVNCVNTINFNNEGFIKGDIKILGNVNCNAMGSYLNKQNELPEEDNKTTTDNNLKKNIKVIFYNDNDEIKVLPTILFIIFIIMLIGGIIISFMLFTKKK